MTGVFREGGHLDTDMVYREGDEKTQEEDDYVPTRERGLEQILPSWSSEENNPADTLTLDFQSLSTVGFFLCVLVKIISALAGACSPGADSRAVCQPPSPRHRVRASRLSSVFQQVPLFIFGQWVSLPLSSPEHLLAAKLPRAVSVRYRFNLTSPEYVGLDQGSADCGLGANLAALCAAHKPGIVSYF